MTDDDEATIRVLAVSKRTGTSERGCAIAVSYVRDGEAGSHVDWLDDFLDAYCPSVQVGSDGLGRSLRADGGVETGGGDRVSPWDVQCPMCGAIKQTPCRNISAEGPTTDHRSFHSERVELAENGGSDTDPEASNQ